jgi:hypothetical protein
VIVSKKILQKIIIQFNGLSIRRKTELSYKDSPTTSKNPDRCTIGSVLIWHMYQPRSDGWTLWMCRNHWLFEGRESEIRGFLVITLLWIVSIVCVSTRTQATYIILNRHNSFFLVSNFTGSL